MADLGVRPQTHKTNEKNTPIPHRPDDLRHGFRTNGP